MKPLPVRSAFLLSAALTLAPAAYANADIVEDLNLEPACETVTDYEGAKACLEPFYKAAMGQADQIYLDLNARFGKLDTDEMSQTLAQEYQTYPQMCLGRENEVLDKSEPIINYMMRAQTCLSISTRLADEVGQSYDEEKAGYLIHRASRLKHFDIR